MIMMERPMKMPGPMEGAEGLGRVIMMAGSRKSAAWMKAVVGILIRVIEEDKAKGALLSGYAA